MYNLSIAKILSPTPSILNEILEDYNNKRYEDAERSALSLSKKFPYHPFSWKILGLLYSETNRLSKAVSSHKKAIKLNPKDATVFNNLSVTFHKLGLFEKA